jgi:hypothetical protein
MLSLFQQFLAVMSKKEQVLDDHEHEVNTDAKEMEAVEKQGHMKDIPESSTQGEARGMTGNSGPLLLPLLDQGSSKGIMRCDLIL